MEAIKEILMKKMVFKVNCLEGAGFQQESIQ